jgi:type I restriction enzyme S subunit
MFMVVRSGILQRTIPVSINLVPLVVNQDQKVFKTKGRVRVDYFYYFVTGNERHLLVDWMKEGTTVESIELEYLYRFPLNVPPLPEQEEIVRYLDTKTQEIDQLVSITQKKIDLLKERRSSLINEVVTKGLNPNVELKDSGVEWIGEIPRHWVVSGLGFQTMKIGSGSTPRGGSEVYVESGIPFIRSQNVHFDGLRLEDVSYIDEETHGSMRGSQVLLNDVLLNITGGSIGRCCVVKEVDVEMNVNQHVCIIRTKDSLNSHFLNYILSSEVGQTQVTYNVSGGNREGLTGEGIRGFKVTLPPLPEQEEIVRYLDTKTQEIDQLVSIEEKRIETLKEYRQCLISEVVTGKVKVTSTEPIHEEG